MQAFLLMAQAAFQTVLDFVTNVCEILSFPEPMNLLWVSLKSSLRLDGQGRLQKRRVVL